MSRLNNARRVHIWMDAEDIEWYKARFNVPGEIGFSGAIQRITHAWRKAMEGRMDAKLKAVSPDAQLSEEELKL